MCKITLNQISNKVLKHIDLEIKESELMVMIGPSGAGKSTLLNVIAGFLPCSGDIRLGDRCVTGLPAHQRSVGYVLQELYLFPHLTVKKNIQLAMKNLSYSNKEKEKKVGKVLHCFELESLAERKPERLSGGEKQRAAMARSVAGEPSVLLLDEPFAHLDFKSAGQMRKRFRSIQKKLGITTLFVTHNLAEAKAMGDRIVLMKNGSISNIFTQNSLPKRFADGPFDLFKASEFRIAS